MNIVQLSSEHHYRKKLCRARWLAVAPIRTSIAHSLDECSQADVIITYKPLDFPKFRKVDIPTIIQVNEVKPDRFKNEIGNAKPTGVVFHHLNDYTTWRQWLGDRSIKSAHIPHVADTEFFRDYGIQKEVDFLLVGTISKRVYPLRTDIMMALTPLAERGFHCRILPHPGNLLVDANECSHLRQFAMAISKAKVVCFCSSVYHYRLSKYVEVAACGSAIAADVPVSEDAIPMVTLRYGMSTEEISNTLMQCCKNADSFATQAKDYAAQHTPQHYSSRLMQFIKTIL